MSIDGKSVDRKSVDGSELVVSQLTVRHLTVCEVAAPLGSPRLGFGFGSVLGLAPFRYRARVGSAGGLAGFGSAGVFFSFFLCPLSFG